MASSVYVVWHQTAGGAALGRWAGRTGGMHWLVRVQTKGVNTYFENGNSLVGGALSGTQGYKIVESGYIDDNESRELLGWHRLGKMGGAAQIEPDCDGTFNIQTELIQHSRLNNSSVLFDVMFGQRLLSSIPTCASAARQ